MKYFLNNSYRFLQAGADCSDCFICPQKLYIDITQECNLWCVMCRDKRPPCGKTMSIEMFEKIVDQTSPYVRSYSLFNWGEPLLAKDFRHMVKYVNQNKRPDCNIEISTNGMLLDRSTSDFLASENVDVIISFDGADKETFEAIRRGSNFERICGNAAYAAELYANRPAHRAPSFYISIQEKNQNQLVKIAELAFRMRIRRIGCGLVVSPKSCAPEQNRALCNELEKMYLYIDRHSMFLETCPTKIGKYIYDGGLYRSASEYIACTVCDAPMVSAAIDYSGDVYLCCNIGECAGSIREDSFLDIWQSERYRMLRRSVNDPSDMPAHCRGCAWFNRN